MHFDFDSLWRQYGGALIGAGQNILAAVAILVIGLWVANRFASGVKRLARRHPRMDDTLATFFARIVRYVLIGMVLLAVLNRFGVETTSLVAVLGAAALAIGLALQGTLSNLAAGIMLILFRPYKLGDQVQLGPSAGKVRDITLFTSELLGPDNVRIVIPNSLIWGAAMTNLSANATRRIDLEFIISYDADTSAAIEALLKVAKADRAVLSDPAPAVDIRRLGDVNIVLWMRAWAATPDWFDTQQALIKAGKDALDALRITPHAVKPPAPV
jgi:small conductance mechanosensitive channel